MVTPEDAKALADVRGLSRIKDGTDLAVRVTAAMKRAPGECKCGVYFSVYCGGCLETRVVERLAEQERITRVRREQREKRAARSPGGEPPAAPTDVAPPVEGEPTAAPIDVAPPVEGEPTAAPIDVAPPVEGEPTADGTKVSLGPQDR